MVFGYYLSLLYSLRLVFVRVYFLAFSWYSYSNQNQAMLLKLQFGRTVTRMVHYCIKMRNINRRQSHSPIQIGKRVHYIKQVNINKLSIFGRRIPVVIRYITKAMRRCNWETLMKPRKRMNKH